MNGERRNKKNEATRKKKNERGRKVEGESVKRKTLRGPSERAHTHTSNPPPPSYRCIIPSPASYSSLLILRHIDKNWIGEYVALINWYTEGKKQERKYRMAEE